MTALFGSIDSLVVFIGNQFIDGFVFSLLWLSCVTPRMLWCRHRWSHRTSLLILDEGMWNLCATGFIMGHQSAFDASDWSACEFISFECARLHNIQNYLVDSLICIIRFFPPKTPCNRCTFNLTQRCAYTMNIFEKCEKNNNCNVSVNKADRQKISDIYLVCITGYSKHHYHP